jgi:hypothetical protein
VLSGIPVLGRRRAEAVEDDGDRLFGGFVVVGLHGLASDYQRLYMCGIDVSSGSARLLCSS